MSSRDLKSIETLLSLIKGDILVGGNSTQSFNKGVGSHRSKTGQNSCQVRAGVASKLGSIAHRKVCLLINQYC